MSSPSSSSKRAFFGFLTLAARGLEMGIEEVSDAAAAAADGAAAAESRDAAGAAAAPPASHGLSSRASRALTLPADDVPAHGENDKNRAQQAPYLWEQKCRRRRRRRHQTGSPSWPRRVWIQRRQQGWQPGSLVPVLPWQMRRCP